MKDISLHILDIAHNSVSAGAKNIIIDIREDIKGGNLNILIQDDGRGMTPDVVQRVTDPYFTSRTSRKVGLGLPLFKQNAQMTGGDLDIESQPGTGTNVKVHFYLNHIDCPPMGDIPGVIILLVSGTTGVEWYYRHMINDKEYVFDTREVKQELEDISLSDPDVIRYLKEMIRENLKEMKSEN